MWIERLIFTLILCSYFVAGAQTYEGAAWQNPAVLGIEKLPPRNSAWPCPDSESGWRSDYDHSPWVRSLDGRWAFHWAPDPDHRPQRFFEPGFDASGWKTIAVPSTIELEGFKSKPLGQPNYGIPVYTNYVYPFAMHPPRVMDEPARTWNTYSQRNPVGSYRLNFRVPSEWQGGRTLLHFAGVMSAMYVWVNGHAAGYSVDSRAPAEFDITPYLKTGENLLAVEVYRYSSSSYLEDQDQWRLSGIFRDVFLYHTPDVSLWDFYVDQKLNADLTEASVGLRYKLRNTYKPGKKLQIRLTLRDPEGAVMDGKPLLEQDVAPVPKGISAELMTVAVRLPSPRLWTNETPALYSALVELISDGKTIEARRVDLGFRTVEVANRQLLINHRSIKIRGVNRHEWSPDTGYTVTRQSMEEDLRLIKQANFNFVRTSHYTDDPRWYELCNRWGMFLMDENNLETHGISYQKRILPGDSALWLPAVVDRMERTVIRDRNAPSVVLWSLGNEAGYGDDFIEMRAVTRANDPQLRPIQYADMNLAADFDSQTYPTTTWLEEYVRGVAVRKGEHGELGTVDQHGEGPSHKPFVANEYAHGQGNSLGNFQEYWDVFEKYPMLVGGFIWEWVDQTPWKVASDGRRFFAYGGDYGDEPHDGDIAKGLVSADRLPRPAYWEVKKVQQPVRLTAFRAADGLVRFHNTQFFSDLKAFTGEWTLLRDGRPIARGALSIPAIGPGREATTHLNWGTRKFSENSEYFLNVRFRTRTKTPWAAAGTVLATDQVEVSRKRLPASPSRRGAVTLSESSSGWTAKAAGTEIRVDRRSGLLTSFNAGGHEALTAPIHPEFWRVPTDNDLGWHVPEKMGAWKEAGTQAKVLGITAHVIAAGAQIEVVLDLERDAKQTLRYCLRRDGTLLLESTLLLGDQAPELPRIGMQFQLPAEWKTVRWYGRGPQENYSDRSTAAEVGIYTLPINEWVTHYVRPQENADRTGVRWVSFTAPGGVGLRVDAESVPVGVAAWPYSMAQLEDAKHDIDLPTDNPVTVTVDGFQMGVGGDNSWSLPVHDQYRLRHKGKYRFAVVLSPVRAAG